jgi:hypothetical protein
VGLHTWLPGHTRVKALRQAAFKVFSLNVASPPLPPEVSFFVYFIFALAPTLIIDSCLKVVSLFPSFAIYFELVGGFVMLFHRKQRMF